MVVEAFTLVGRFGPWSDLLFVCSWWLVVLANTIITVYPIISDHYVEETGDLTLGRSTTVTGEYFKHTIYTYIYIYIYMHARNERLYRSCLIL